MEEQNKPDISSNGYKSQVSKAPSMLETENVDNHSSAHANQESCTKANKQFDASSIQTSKPSIQKNTIYNVIKTLSTIVFPVITFPYISRVLQVDNIGKLNFGNAVVSYISLIASLGISTYAIRECSKVKNDRDELDRVSSEIYSISLISTAFAYIVLLMLLLFWPRLRAYRTLIFIQSMSVVLGTIGTNWINSAMEDFRYITIRTFAFQILSLILMFLLVRKPGDYMTYAMITVISAAGANIINILYRRKYCRIRFTPRINWKKHWRPVLFLFAMLLAQTVYVSTDQVMIGIYWSDHEVGLYSTAVKIYNIVNSMVASVYIVVMPQISAAYQEKDYEKINKLFLYAASIIITFGLPCVVGLNVICKDIIMIIAGEEYLGSTASLHILTAALAFSLFGGLIGNVLLLPSGREKICFRNAIISAAVNFLTNLVLIPKFGIEAAACTTALAEGVALLLCVQQVDKQIDKFAILKTIKAPIAGCTAIIAISVVIRLLECGKAIEPWAILICSVVAYTMIQVLLKNDLVLSMISKLQRRKGIGRR